MSRLPLPGPIRAASTVDQARRISVQIEARVAEVVATLGYLPPALVGALHERTFDLMNHHRRSVLKHNRFPAGRRAQKMLAARTYRYGATVRNPVKLEQIVGESFALEPSEAFGDALTYWEHGGTVRTTEAMAIPFFAGLSGRRQRGDRASKAFVQLLEGGLFDIAKPRGILFAPSATRRRLKGVEGTAGYRSVIYGAARRVRRQPPILGFYARFESMFQYHLAKYERDIAMAITEAGRAALEARYADERRFTRGSFERQYRRELMKYLQVNRVLGDNARRVIKQAREAARRQSEKGAA